MKKLYSIIAILIFLGSPLLAQKWVNPHFPAHRIDYRDLGYPSANEIPADNSPITALLAHSNGRIYGATSGKTQSWLFAYDGMINKVLPLGAIAEEEGVHHSLLEGKDGKIYIGTGKNQIVQLNLTKDFPGGRRAIENQLWDDIKAYYQDYDGGRIFSYDPASADQEVYLLEDKAKVTDLGVAVPGNSIYAMTFNADTSIIYGFTYPDAILFEYNLASGKFAQLGEWLTEKSYAGPERTWRSVPRSLIAGSDGKIYSSGEDGLITSFDPLTRKISQTTMRIPGEYWEAWNYNGYPVVEQLVQDPETGLVYGSTSDGFIFRMDLDRNDLVNLGKPRITRRVRAMTLGNDRQLYMICGEFEEVCKMYSYDLDGKTGIRQYGVLGVDRSPYYAKRPYQFDAMVTGQNGDIFIGESDRRAKLFIYTPGAGNFAGGLNPTNPR